MVVMLPPSSKRIEIVTLIDDEYGATFAREWRFRAYTEGRWSFYWFSVIQLRIGTQRAVHYLYYRSIFNQEARHRRRGDASWTQIFSFFNLHEHIRKGY